VPEGQRAAAGEISVRVSLYIFVRMNLDKHGPAQADIQRFFQVYQDLEPSLRLFGQSSLRAR
jgi:hypothetical protein